MAVPDRTEQSKRLVIYLTVTGSKDIKGAKAALAADQWDVARALLRRGEEAVTAAAACAVRAQREQKPEPVGLLDHAPDKAKEPKGGGAVDVAAAVGYQWVSLDPRNKQEVPYNPGQAARIEKEYHQGTDSFLMIIGPSMKFTIDLNSMTQTSASGGMRKIWRIPEMEPKFMSNLVVPFDTSTERMQDRMQVIMTVDRRVKRVIDSPSSANVKELKELLSGCTVQGVLEVYQEISQQFRRDEFKEKYGFQTKDRALVKIKPRQKVPEYWANVDTGQSVWHRKMLSIAGLANLVIFGPEIVAELREQNFSGCPDDYKDKCGPHKMVHYTGNAVDLDTVVLRASDPVVLRTINMQNKKLGIKEHASGDAFGASKQAREIAVTAAGPLIEQFCQDFSLRGRVREKRRLEFDGSNTKQSIPKATVNSDRGKWPVWQYINEGVNSFHVNVPNMPDVYGAIIRAPWQLAKAYLIMIDEFPPGPDRDKWLRDFFEDAVTDSCFNAKWKGIEEFCGRLRKLGTVLDKLEKLQKINQVEFSKIYDLKGISDEEKDLLEVALLWRLSIGMAARDKFGRMRNITEADCKSFVNDPGLQL